MVLYYGLYYLTSSNYTDAKPTKVKYIDEYRDKSLTKKLIAHINQYSSRDYTFMEVCGGHTMAIHRFGIPSLLPGNIRLLSGPGCPVCVTGKAFIDKAIAYAGFPNFIITTFGDLIKVPGSDSSLAEEKANGNDIRTVYSMLEALQIARENPSKTVVFLAIGFETTAPGTAVGIKEAYKSGLKNFFILSAHKVMPPAMEAIIDDTTTLDGYLCPGHVSTITGTKIYEEFPRTYGVGCVVAGFEPVDILQSILLLIQQMEDNTPKVEIQYKRAVKPEGNTTAKKYMDEVFEKQDDWWRGLGLLKNSGLKLNDTYKQFDVEYQYPLEIEAKPDTPGCICGNILKGKNTPPDCPLFGNTCTPANPVGACMVSGEGACQAYYKYNYYE